LTLLLLAGLAGGVVLFVLFPIFARASEVSQRPTEVAQERKSLSEKKDRLYEAIKDVEFEYQAGKLSDTDYESVRADFLNQAAKVIARLDEIDKSDVVGAAATPKKASEAVQRSEESPPNTDPESTEAASGTSCPSCEQPNPAGAQFCMHCGSEMTNVAECPQCGTELQKEARFCNACGVAILV
jgi:hypothetical protein